MKYVIFIFISGFIFLVGCGGMSPQMEKQKENTSLIIGYIDMDDAPSDLEWAWLEQLRPRKRDSSIKMRDYDGVFYLENLANGVYQLSSFGGHKSFGNTTYTYNFPRQNNNMRIKITKPGIYFVGSYHYEVVEKGFFEEDNFILKPIDTPSEVEILNKISKYAKGTKWVDIINQRLKELK